MELEHPDLTIPTGRDVGITFSLDLEDNLASKDKNKRYPFLTRKVLSFLTEHDIKGSFFVVGNVAREQPDLVCEISDRGHEIGYHSRGHIPLTQDTPDRFRRETEADKIYLETLTGKSVIGYRAPQWSLIESTVWVVQAIGELDFVYSSSVLPAANPLFGFPNAPNIPFRWPNGILEFPLPLVNIGQVKLPLLGGIYLRYLLTSLQEWAIGRIDPNAVLWTYCHPYDFDSKQSFIMADGLNFLMSVLLWCNRTRTFQKMSNLLKRRNAPNFADQINSGRFNSISKVFDPQISDTFDEKY